MNILLVDDSKSARYALRLQLQRYGIEVQTDDAAESALERVRRNPPDAIFMDHTMPGMNGFEALEILKAAPATKHIPVIMCTSSRDPEFIAQAKKKGALDILSKSAAAEKIASLLERLQHAIAEPALAPAWADGSVPGVNTTPEPQAVAAGALTEEQLDKRIRALIAPHIDTLSEHLASDLIARTDEKLVSRMSEEANRLQKHFIKAQSEQAQLTTTRLINEVLPQIVRQQLEEEKRNIAQMAQNLIDASLDALLDEPSFPRRMLDSTEANVNTSSDQLAKRQVEEIAESVATERACEVAERLTRSVVRSTAPMYLLAAGASLIGVGSAAVVFFLLS